MNKMILADKGVVKFKGAGVELEAELVTVLHAFREMMAKECSEKESEEIFNRIVEFSRKSEEQVEKEREQLRLKAQAEELLEDILKKIIILKGLKE